MDAACRRGGRTCRGELEAKFFDILDTPDAATARLGTAIKVPKRLGAAVLTKSEVTKASANVGKYAWFHFGDDVQLQIHDYGTLAFAQERLKENDADRDLAPHLKKVAVGSFEARAIDRLSIPSVDDPNLHDPVWGSKIPGTGVETGGAHVTWSVGKFGIDLSSGTLSSDELLKLANEAWPKGQ
jgi:hypothetical protein